jgi:hypothetical protein
MPGGLLFDLGAHVIDQRPPHPPGTFTTEQVE